MSQNQRSEFEESVLVQLSIVTVASQSIVYLPVLEALADKLNLEGTDAGYGHVA